MGSAVEPGLLAFHAGAGETHGESGAGVAEGCEDGGAAFEEGCAVSFETHESLRPLLGIDDGSSNNRADSLCVCV